jgi:hypothetical protein
MRAAAYGRLAAGLELGDLLLAHRRTPASPNIESLLLIWTASEAEEWAG